MSLRLRKMPPAASFAGTGSRSPSPPAIARRTISPTHDLAEDQRSADRAFKARAPRDLGSRGSRLALLTLGGLTERSLSLGRQLQHLRDLTNVTSLSIEDSPTLG